MIDGYDGPDSARIWQKHVVERESHVLGDGESKSIIPGDFTLPLLDALDPVNLEVTLESLDLLAGIEPQESTPTETTSPTSDATDIRELQTYLATMKFCIVVASNETKNMNVALTYDVHFVTAHPCVPTSNITLLSSPTTPMLDMFSSSPPSLSGRRPSGPHGLFTGKSSSSFIVLVDLIR